MKFLNEVAGDFPSAISFAAGQPTERFFGRLSPDVLAEKLVNYERYAKEHLGFHNARFRVLQYGRTAGIITDLVARQLCEDEGVAASPDRVMITSGCQEALALCLPALCPEPTDVTMVCNPTYVGATCAAQANGVRVFPLLNSALNLAEQIERSVDQLNRSGRHVRVVYLIPNFDNPTGQTLDENQRRTILATCARHRIVVLEDNAYGMFRYEGQTVQPMAALDKSGGVIYLSTFSKTLAPAFRIGAITLPETLFGDRKASQSLFEKLVRRKSILTVNTSQVTQAIVGGILLEQNCSLKKWVSPALMWYRDNRDEMLCQLERAFGRASGRVRWSVPSGGFFLSMDLPFPFDGKAALECAADFGVIVMPMRFFSLDNSQDRRIRLAFSSVDPDQIRAGVVSLAEYIKKRCST